MSRVTDIKTKNEIEIIEVCKKLADDGYNIAVKDEKPTAKIYIPGVSIREIEITKEDYGYEVRITVLACKEDFELYRDTIKHIMEMTGGKAVYESGEKIKNPTRFFNDEFIDESMDSDLNVTLIMVREGNEMAIFCPFREFYIGKNIIKQLSKYGDNHNAIRSYLYNLIRRSQYEKISTDDTPVFIIKRKDSTETEDEDELNLDRLTIYKKNGYDFISWAKYVGLWDENENRLVILYEDLYKIAPDSWTLFDEKQFRTAQLSDDEWSEFWERAKVYETEIG